MTANPSANATPENTTPESAAGSPAPAASSPASAPAPASGGGIRSKLTDAQKAMLASKSGGGAPAGWKSTGKGHKPTSASGKRAKTEKKVRW